MEQKFTQMAQEALSDAVQNAAALGNPQVDTLHLLDAMLRPEPAKGDGRQLLKDLSERELEVLTALAEGLGNKEIGERLFISPRTVDTHRTNLMRKLGVHNVVGLVRIAVQAGLVK